MSFIQINTRFTTKLFVSLNQSYVILSGHLAREGFTEKEIDEYINSGDKSGHVQGRTTLFHDKDIVLIKLNYFSDRIRDIAILVHELSHASKRIIQMYKFYKEKDLLNEEEAECYLLDYLFEEIMCELKPRIDYTKEYRDFDWLHKITHYLTEN